MKDIYLQLRQRARQIVSSLPLPRFYTSFKAETAASVKFFSSNPLLIKLHKEISPVVENDFGHGMFHTELVCRDAGALVQLELKSISIPGAGNSKLDRAMLLVQIAGLLHDIKRKEKDHSIEGARFAKSFLNRKQYSLASDEIAMICNAIKTHEAFTSHKGNQTGYTGSLIANALYDADKFRWGPDNFTHTVWDMVSFSNTSIEQFIEKYPVGMERLTQIRETFRTDTGKIFGPDFIDLGIETGERLFEIIQNEFV